MGEILISNVTINNMVICGIYAEVIIAEMKTERESILTFSMSCKNKMCEGKLLRNLTEKFDDLK